MKTSYNPHYCTLMQIPLPEIPTPDCKYVIPPECVRGRQELLRQDHSTAIHLGSTVVSQALLSIKVWL